MEKQGKTENVIQCRLVKAKIKGIQKCNILRLMKIKTVPTLKGA
jgi:hypothetical protein